MKVKIRWLLTGLAVAVIAVLVAGYAVLVNLDVEQYRDEIQARAKAATGRDLVLDGPIELRGSLTPAITATTPHPCSTVRVSPSASQATPRATSGTRLEYSDVRALPS